MTIDELLEKVRYASDTSVTGQLAAEVRRLLERERVLVETVKLYACKDFWKPYHDEHMGLTTKAASDRGCAARAALEAVKE